MSNVNKVNNVTSNTISSRKKIGFLPHYTLWRDEAATFTDDTLTISGHPVMESWEDSYMKDLAEIACSRGGAVLEVGFGMGISASYIQQQVIEKHIVIEANRDVFVHLQRFASNSRVPVVPMFGFWQEAVAAIPDNSLDGILFDTYPLTEEEIHKNHFTFFEEAYRMLKPNGILTYYSDEESDFSAEHIRVLQEAGFSKINKRICHVQPPSDCKYWQSNMIMSPIITK